MDKAIFAYNHDDRYVAAIKAYAQDMLENPLAYDGYYEWQVFFAHRSTARCCSPRASSPPERPIGDRGAATGG